MAAIAESADLLTVKNQSWLLMPAPAWLLDTLALFGTEAEDRENDLEDEPTDGAEPGAQRAIYGQTRDAGTGARLLPHS